MACREGGEACRWLGTQCGCSKVDNAPLDKPLYATWQPIDAQSAAQLERRERPKTLGRLRFACSRTSPQESQALKAFPFLLSRGEA